MMADIVTFKLINDRFSHTVGDEILVAVGAILNGHIRGIDLPARMGGEEFMVLFPESGLADAVAAAETFRRAIECHPWPERHPGLRVTVSVGVAEARAEADTRALLAEADAQLHRAKDLGKNRVCFPVGGRRVETLAEE